MKNIDILEIGNSCNNANKCNMCLLGEKRYNKGKDSQIDTYKKLKENYPETKFFIYPAEITTSPYLVDLLAENKQAAMTNGLQVDQKFIDLLENKITKLTFSLYSDASEQAVFYRTSETNYNYIIRGIELASSKGLDVSVFTIITSDNLQKFPEVFRLSRELGVKKIDVMRLIPIGKAKEMNDRLYLAEQDVKNLLRIINEPHPH